jgi:beta-galactosidase
MASYAGTYTVILSNAFSVVSTQAVVSYVVPPTIITQPKSHSISSSSTATVSVAATGSPGLSYEWFFNGASTGVTNSTFSISGFQQQIFLPKKNGALPHHGGHGVP